MKDKRIKEYICTGCMAEISEGQSVATKFTFGNSLCVKCCSGYSKFDSIISRSRKPSYSFKL